MRVERIELEDVMLTVIGINASNVMVRYLNARQCAIKHKIPEVNLILSRTYGVLVWRHQVDELTRLAGLTAKEAKLFRVYQFISIDKRDALMQKFMTGMLESGYDEQDAMDLFQLLAYTACDTWKREGVAAQVKQFLTNLKMFV